MGGLFGLQELIPLPNVGLCKPMFCKAIVAMGLGALYSQAQPALWLLLKKSERYQLILFRQLFVSELKRSIVSRWYPCTVALCHPQR
jgi:hypothetical protein